MTGILQAILSFFGVAPAAAANYIEDVFSTYLYTGTGSSQTITNGIDLSGKGGLVWLKSRNNPDSHYIVDTARGSNKVIYSNLTNAEETLTRFSSFNSNGFSLSTTASNPNVNGYTYASWTFRKQAKFFDVVTYTGNGTNPRNISHNLGSTPGCIIVKCTSAGSTDWMVYHRSLSSGGFGPYTIYLNLTNAQNANDEWNTAPTSTVFTVNNSNVNTNGATYVAYLFAHDAGGFGATGSDNVISCGSFTCDGSGNADVTLGYEPQWLLVKPYDAAGYPWYMADIMRGMPLVGDTRFLRANTNGAETGDGGVATFRPTATGFQVRSFSQANIYIAIRRGPMKTPTSGTSVFGLSARSGTGANATVTGSAGVSDAVLIKNRGSAVGDLFAARLTGTGYLETSSTAAEVAAGTTILQANPWDVMDGVKVGTTSTITNATSNTYINYLFDRAPGFFDVVCYTGDGTNMTINHNLGAVPELMIVKRRSITGLWFVYSAGTTTPNNYYLRLEDTGAQVNAGAQVWNNTSTTFLAGTGLGISASTQTYVAYLFATVAGVSKVGSYTGTGTTLQVNCGFTAGARFVMIKRTDSTGDWYVWDTARGIIAGDDPYLLMNSTAAEVTNTDYVDTYSAGFEISSTAPAAINASGGTYLFLAIA